MLKLRKTRRTLATLATAVALTGVATLTTATSASAATGQLLQNDYTGLCLSIGGNNYHNGAPVDQYGCGGYPDQYYYTTSSGRYPGYYYIVLQEGGSNLCLTHNTPNNNAQLTVTYCGNNANQGNVTQLWRDVWDSSFGSMERRSFVDDWCLSIPGASSGWSVPVNTWPCGPYPDQHWSFV